MANVFTLSYIKNYLRVDHTNDDIIIQDIMNSVEKNASETTGLDLFDISNNVIATEEMKYAILQHIAHCYKNKDGLEEFMPNSVKNIYINLRGIKFI